MKKNARSDFEDHFHSPDHFDSRGHGEADEHCPVNPYIERFIQRVREDGCRLPVSRQVLQETYGYVKDEIIREMARQGMLVLSEAWDGSLPPVAAAMLEHFHVTSRENFRTRYLAGEFVPTRWRLIGKVTQMKLLIWAGVMTQDDGKWESTLNLPVQTWKDIDAMVKKRGLGNRSELVTQLVAEARTGGKSTATPAKAPPP